MCLLLFKLLAVTAWFILFIIKDVQILCVVPQGNLVNDPVTQNIKPVVFLNGNRHVVQSRMFSCLEVFSDSCFVLR